MIGEEIDRSELTSIKKQKEGKNNTKRASMQSTLTSWMVSSETGEGEEAETEKMTEEEEYEEEEVSEEMIADAAEYDEENTDVTVEDDTFSDLDDDSDDA